LALRPGSRATFFGADPSRVPPRGQPATARNRGSQTWPILWRLVPGSLRQRWTPGTFHDVLRWMEVAVGSIARDVVPGEGVNPAGPAAMIARLWNGSTRPMLVVIGGILTLHGADRLDVPKVGYLSLTVLAVLGAVVAAWRARDDDVTAAARPWFALSLVIALIVAMSLPVSMAAGVSPITWLRDVAAYGLLAAAPWLGADLARDGRARLIFGALLVAGTIGALSFTIEWLQRRNFTDLPLDRLGLPSLTLAAVAYAVALAIAVVGPGRLRWGAFAAAILGCLLLTGTRTSFVLLAAFLAYGAILMVTQRRHGLAVIAQIGLIQLLTIVLVVGMSVIGRSSEALLPGGNPTESSSPDSQAEGGAPVGELGDRFVTIDDVATGRDPSFVERIEQTRVAWSAFAEHPFLGVGPGFEFTWVRSSGTVFTTTYLDTPLVVIAKFGVLGLALFVAIICAFALTVRRLVVPGGWTWVALGVLGYGAILFALLPFGWPPEDKGTGIAMILLISLACAPGALKARRQT
jgi:hypothetical protein